MQVDSNIESDTIKLCNNIKQLNAMMSAEKFTGFGFGSAVLGNGPAEVKKAAAKVVAGKSASKAAGKAASKKKPVVSKKKPVAKPASKKPAPKKKVASKKAPKK